LEDGLAMIEEYEANVLATFWMMLAREHRDVILRALNLVVVVCT